MRWTDTAGTSWDSVKCGGKASEKHPPRKDSNCISVVETTNMNNESGSSFTKTP